MSTGSVPAIEVAGLEAGYGGSRVLHGVDLAVAPKEFVAILGSSGCGKTTLLRSVAGFQKVSAGAVRLLGREVTGLAPERRGVAMVFQSYALWPHMTVAGNVGYGLRLRRMPAEARRERVARVLAMLNLAGLEERKVTALSGGQRQRVALGRALAVEPEILLLDEPMSNLDAKVRLQVRAEIKALQARLGFAALHVTHDREEAMTMADRIVVMDAGRIVQVGTPEEVYDRPVSPFVAGFMGADNTLGLEVRRDAGGLEARVEGAAPVRFAGDPARPTPLGAVTAYFRDDAPRLDAPDAAADGAIVLPGRLVRRSYPGGQYRYAVAVGDRHFAVTDARHLPLDAPVGLRLPLASLHLFPRA